MRFQSRAARAVMVAALLALAGTLPALGQDGRVKGQVVDLKSREPLKDAKVVLKNVSGGSVKATTNEKGEYRMVHVRFGDYEVTVEREGYRPFKGSFVVEPKSNDDTVINVQLEKGGSEIHRISRRVGKSGGS